MKKENLFSDLAGIVSEKKKKEKAKMLLKEKNLRKTAPLKRQKLRCLFPMVKDTILQLMRTLRKQGHLYNLSVDSLELCFSKGWPNDYNNRILTIMDSGNYFSIISGNTVYSDKTSNLSQESLVETLKKTAFVKNTLKNL